MAQLNPIEIASYAKGAGLTNPVFLTIAVAVAIAESGGDPNQRYAPGTGEDSYGLWQINLDPRYKESRMKTLGITSPEQLFDPATNAKAMMKLSSGGTKWGPWTTFTSGKYRQNLSKFTLDDITKAVPKTGPLGTPGMGADGVTGALNALGSVPGALLAFTQAFLAVPAAVVATTKWITDRKNVTRVLWGITGVTFLGMAAYSLVGGKMIKAGKEVVQLAAGASPTGKVGKIAKGVSKASSIGGSMKDAAKSGSSQLTNTKGASVTPIRKVG